MSGCLLGAISFAIAETEDGSEVIVSHQVVGVYDKAVIEMYRGGWETLLQDGLKAFVERGVESWQVA